MSKTTYYPLPITVSIAGESVDYHLRRTGAPKAFDGFGTIAIYEYDGGPEHKADSFRLVLIRSEHLGWQTSRYSSGMFAAEPPEEWQYSEVIELLRKRLLDPSAYQQ
jgi:hypothetical protein